MDKRMVVPAAVWRAAWQEAAKRPMREVLAMLQGHEWTTWLIVLRAWQGKP